MVLARAGKLGLECLHGIQDKLPKLREWLGERGLVLERSIFVGNDINDVECLAESGLGVVVADAHPSALAVADLRLGAAGGAGALRELTDALEAVLERRSP